MGFFLFQIAHNPFWQTMNVSKKPTTRSVHFSWRKLPERILALFFCQNAFWAFFSLNEQIRCLHLIYVYIRKYDWTKLKAGFLWKPAKKGEFLGENVVSPLGKIFQKKNPDPSTRFLDPIVGADRLHFGRGAVNHIYNSIFSNVQTHFSNSWFDTVGMVGAF